MTNTDPVINAVSEVLAEATLINEADDTASGIEHFFNKGQFDKIITHNPEGRVSPDYRFTVDMTKSSSDVALDAARTALRASNPGMRIVTKYRLGRDNPAAKDYETTAGIRKADAQRADVYLTDKRPPGYREMRPERNS